MERMAFRGRLRWSILAGGLLIAVASPVLTSLGLPDEFSPGFYGPAVRGDDKALLNLVAPTVGGRCTAAIPVSIDGPVFAYTGYRLVMSTTDRLHPGNFARIRWRDIYQRITPKGERMRDNLALIEGLGSSARIQDAANKYGVDVVVASSSSPMSDAFEGYRRIMPDDWPFPIYRLTDCGEGPSAEIGTRDGTGHS